MMAFMGWSHWTHALIYISLSVFLAVLAISLSPRSGKSPAATHFDNATRALRLSGYNSVATFLHNFPNHLLTPSAVTIFAVPDQAISNASLPPSLVQDFLRYHTVPAKLPAGDLIHRPVGSCLPTNLRGRNLAVTEADERKGTVYINGILITLPDIFLDGPYAVHGASAPLFAPGSSTDDFDPPDLCKSRSGVDLAAGKSAIPWQWITRSLCSKGFVSFSIGLHAVLDENLDDFRNLSSVTIFAPRDDGFAYVAFPSPLLQHIVKSHISPQRFSFDELARLPNQRVLPTLVPGRNLRLHRSVSSQQLSADQVEIMEPDAILFEHVAVHGISHAFEIAKF